MRIAPAIVLNPEQRSALEQPARSRSLPARVVKRARIVLLAAEAWRIRRDRLVALGAMARCAGDTFFKRVACEQGVGQQYCEGYWGKVPQCPSGPPPVKGQ